MKVSGNFAFPTMLQSVAWPSFSVYGGSLKIENWKSKIAINFCFRPKHSKSLTELLKREGVGSIRTVNIFAPSALFVDPLPSMRFFFFFLPLPPSFLSHATERRKREIRIYRAVTFPNMSDFSAEYINDFVITKRKTLSEVSLLLKERFPHKKGFSLSSVRRFCFENGINLHNRLSNDAWAVPAGRRCSGKYKFIKL